MMRIYLIILGCSLLVFSNAQAFEARWPQVVEGDCPEVLIYGRADFYKNAGHVIEEGLNKNALDGPHEPFSETIRTPQGHMGSTQVLDMEWQKQPQEGKRFVVLRTPMNWEGDFYYLFVVDGGMDLQAFQQWLAVPEHENEALISDSWTQPQILQLPSKSVVAVDYGHPAEFVSEWRVFGLHDSKPICRVRFGPHAKSVFDLLPKGPLEELAQALNGTLGPGKDEGTLQPTARLRVHTGQIWAKMMLQPWALREAPYNTRQEVDAGLLAWSKQSSSYRKQYVKIQKLYPEAERALVSYYIKQFGCSQAQAQTAAAYALDIVYRSFYSFHSEEASARLSDYEPNPWKAF